MSNTVHSGAEACVLAQAAAFSLLTDRNWCAGLLGLRIFRGRGDEETRVLRELEKISQRVKVGLLHTTAHLDFHIGLWVVLPAQHVQQAIHFMHAPGPSWITCEKEYKVCCALQELRKVSPGRRRRRRRGQPRVEPLSAAEQADLFSRQQVSNLLVGRKLA